MPALATAAANGLLTQLLKGTTYTVTTGTKLRLMSALAANPYTTAGTEVTGGSYVAGGIALSGSMGTAANGAITNTAPLVFSGLPATNIAGIEVWDLAGTPIRLFWQPLAGGMKAVNAGDSFTLATGNLTFILG